MTLRVGRVHVGVVVSLVLVAAMVLITGCGVVALAVEVADRQAAGQVEGMLLAEAGLVIAAVVWGLLVAALVVALRSWRRKVTVVDAGLRGWY